MYQLQYALIAFVVVSGRAIASNAYVVDRAGHGDYVDLQIAVDSVPDGSTLLLVADADGDGWSDPFAPVKIHHSVTLIGLDDLYGSEARIGGLGWDGSSGANGASLLINAAADSIVVLERLNVDPGPSYDPTHAIDAINVGSLILKDCVVVASKDTDWDYDGSYTEPAHALFVECSAKLIAIYSSTLVGAGGTTETNINESDHSTRDTVVGASGGDALRAPSAKVIVVSDSILVGGEGGQADWGAGNDGSGDHHPTELTGGVGGNGVVGSAFVSGGSLTLGTGGPISWRDTNWGNGETGADGVQFTGQETDLGNFLTITGLPAIGGSLTIAGTGFSAFRAGLIFVATAFGDPVHLRTGTWFLGFPFIFAGFVVIDGSGGFTVNGTLPNDPALVGASIVLQVADTEHVSEPGLFVVVPP